MEANFTKKVTEINTNEVIVLVYEMYMPAPQNTFETTKEYCVSYKETTPSVTMVSFKTYRRQKIRK